MRKNLALKLLMIGGALPDALSVVNATWGRGTCRYYGGLGGHAHGRVMSVPALWLDGGHAESFSLAILIAFLRARVENDSRRSAVC